MAKQTLRPTRAPQLAPTTIFAFAFAFAFAFHWNTLIIGKLDVERALIMSVANAPQFGPTSFSLLG